MAEWIKCSERMPSENVQVWAFPRHVKRQREVCVATVHMYPFGYEWGIDDEALDEITHWKPIKFPLPPPPEAE